MRDPIIGRAILKGDLTCHIFAIAIFKQWVRLESCWPWPVTSMAGGFWIKTYSPSALVTASIPDAVVIVAAEGCHNAADASISATAEGVIKGKRQSVLLELTPMSKGVYAVRRQWPGAGA